MLRLLGRSYLQVKGLITSYLNDWTPRLDSLRLGEGAYSERSGQSYRLKAGVVTRRKVGLGGPAYPEHAEGTTESAKGRNGGPGWT